MVSLNRDELVNAMPAPSAIPRGPSMSCTVTCPPAPGTLPVEIRLPFADRTRKLVGTA